MDGASAYYHERASRLLLQALGTGSNGFLAMYKLSQMFPGPFPWMSVLEDFCTKVPTLDDLTGDIILKPKMTLLPLHLQRNLFSVLNFFLPLLPTTCIQLLAKTVTVKDYFSDAWLLHLTQQFLKNCGLEATLQSPQVIERLQTLCKGLNNKEAKPSKLDWYKKTGPSSQQTFCDLETFLKDDSQLLLNVCPEELCANSQSVHFSQKANTVEIANSEEMQNLPSSVKGHVSILKQFLFLEMDSETLEDEFVLQLKKMCDSCNPLQLQTVLITAGVSQISTKCLFQFCVYLDSISPDLSYAHAKLLASSLFLDQVLSLTSPASRSLIAALTVFCKKYAQPACKTLLGPILVQAKQGSVYADFLCRMISECLESHQLYLCFSSVLEVSCSEVSITLLDLLIEKTDNLSPSEIEHLINFLCIAAENFSKSMTFSKLLLVILTNKHDMVQPSHIGPLTNTLDCNQTFMKRALQSALMKLQNNFK